MKSKNKIVTFLLGHKFISIFSVLMIMIAVGGGIYFYSNTTTSTPALNADQASSPITEQPLIDNPEMLSEIGLTKEAVEESPSIGVTQGRCKGDKAYYYDPSGTLSVTSMQRGGTYICTTYEVNTVKSYVKSNGDVVTEETYANADTGTRQTVKKTQTTDGTNGVNVGYEAPDGTGMGWGGTGTEQCFGPNNTVCTIVDTGVGPTFITMLETCILVSTGDGYWRLGTPADNLTANTLADGSSCSSWQNYKNLFYNK